MSEQEAIINKFSKNRAEEFGYDLWGKFIIPLFYNELIILNATKPRIIEGVRGCGKTMLLRYFSYHTQFSGKRSRFFDDYFPNIGITWKADTYFSYIMNDRDVKEEEWVLYFSHYLSISFAIEITNSLITICKSKYEEEIIEQIEKIDFSSLEVLFNTKFAKNFNLNDLFNFLKVELRKLQALVNNPHECKVNLIGKELLINIISLISENLNNKSLIYHIFIDEYENLRNYQKRIINSWLKNSDQNLMFHIAVKRNAFDFKETLGTEILEETHDYRVINLDKKYRKNFNVFAGEILLSVLRKKEVFDPAILFDREKLSDRQEKNYQTNVIKQAKKILPSLEREDLARKALESNSVMRTLKNKLIKAFKKKNLESEEYLASFLDKNYPSASIIMPALLNRSNLRIEDIKIEFEKYKKKAKSKFDNWIDNIFIDAILQLYSSYNQFSPIYSGFDTLIQLSNSNIRYFNELVYYSIYEEDFDDTNLVIKPELQAKGALRVSSKYIEEVKSFRPLGHTLYRFLIRLCKIFQLSRENPKISESERNHFSIKTSYENLPEKYYDFFQSSIKNSVLLDSKATKKKEDNTIESYEYKIHPIFTPYFMISYRKKRKLYLDIVDFEMLLAESANDFNIYYKEFSKKWEIEDSKQENLFNI